MSDLKAFNCRLCGSAPLVGLNCANCSNDNCHLSRAPHIKFAAWQAFNRPSEAPAAPDKVEGVGMTRECKTCKHFDGVNARGWGSCGSDEVAKVTNAYDENGESSYPEVHENFGCAFHEAETVMMVSGNMPDTPEVKRALGDLKKAGLKALRGLDAGTRGE